MDTALPNIVALTSDEGTTKLSDGSRVEKNTPRIEVIGTIDELNCLVGQAKSLMADICGAKSLCEMITLIQYDLFDLSNCILGPDGGVLSEEHVLRLERMEAELSKSLPPLKERIIPGGTPASSAVHVARSVAHRAERRLKSLFDEEPQHNSLGLSYLNKLSDVFYVMARTVARTENAAEIYWEKGASPSRKIASK